MNNPVDLMEVLRDLIRKDECQQLFEQLYEETKRADEERIEDLAASEDVQRAEGYKDGLEFAMDILDERIEHLRDRWTDSDILSDKGGSDG